jgi:IS1 family transposase
MNFLPLEKRIQIIAALVEGTSMRSAARMADVSINTVTKLLIDVGSACLDYQDSVMRNLPLKDVQVDEIWSFVGAKQKNVADGADPSLMLGDCYTFTAIDRETKLMPCWLVGHRTAAYADWFMADLASRVSGRIQLTTDGMSSYPDAVDRHFGSNVDYAVLNKSYEGGPSATEARRRYSPSKFVGASKVRVTGNPAESRVSTSHVERANLTMRMNMRRFTRLTNAFSKKVENHMHAVSLHMMHYNFARIHKTLRVTPAMAAGVSDHVWTIEEIVNLVPAPVAKKRGSYKPRQSISN